MNFQEGATESSAAAESSSPDTVQWTRIDIESILRSEGWLAGTAAPQHLAWCERTAALLGPQASDRANLKSLLRLVFHYDAVELMSHVESQIAVSRYGARDVLRQAGRLLLEGPKLDSDGFKQLVTTLRGMLELTGHEILIPMRLALAGRIGQGELDRVILLLDDAANLAWTVPVKSVRTRIVEFCAALD
jgi:hypothetical protein